MVDSLTSERTYLRSGRWKSKKKRDIKENFDSPILFVA